MIRTRLAVLATLTLAGVAAAPAGSQRAPAPMTFVGLSPLSERDMREIDETGCEFAFNVPRGRTLVYSMNDKLMVRTADGAGTCRLAEGPLGAFTQGAGSVSCAGRRLTLRKMGRATSHAEADSTTWPALLTVTQGTTMRSIRGEAGTAC